jgi:hypothetical protein
MLLQNTHGKLLIQLMNSVEGLQLSICFIFSVYSSLQVSVGTPLKSMFISSRRVTRLMEVHVQIRLLSINIYPFISMLFLHSHPGISSWIFHPDFLACLFCKFICTHCKSTALYRLFPRPRGSPSGPGDPCTLLAPAPGPLQPLQ